MFNLKTRYYFIISFISLLVAVGFILLAIYGSDNLNTSFIIMMSIAFIISTLSLQYGIQKLFRIKEEKHIYKEYISNIDIEKKLDDENFILRKRDYGKSYIKIIDDTLFKIVIIDDVDIYFKVDSSFNNENEEIIDEKLKKKIDKCKKMISYEIFLNNNKELYRRINHFSVQVDKLYLSAFIKEDNIYKCYNYLAPLDIHKENITYLLNLIGMVENE